MELIDVFLNYPNQCSKDILQLFLPFEIRLHYLHGKICMWNIACHLPYSCSEVSRTGGPLLSSFICHRSGQTTTVHFPCNNVSRDFFLVHIVSLVEEDSAGSKEKLYSVLLAPWLALITAASE